ncbi:pilus assembly protein TadG-related protein [Streptomyces sp. ITFR-6]|uniref:pilus assembly protein TadG-related protein n=1 Tax=Streptomyces sp. ITFR-6 TaxID=3075197 RepID=UPI002889D394|nr:pilus assembly protein TadG-related protein [Streptomyces sp. ITFR-6]WNI29561.1 pilus assembly protein TadG-related protein [Streptomyces sp. ITFR-6]
MAAKDRSEAGQAFPIYIVMVAGLLFLAFAFFAVGQASATRNGAQGAADAAALAAAQQARDDLELPFLQALRDPDGLDDFLSGYQYFRAGESEAVRLASRNRSDLTDFHWKPGYWQDRVTAKVRTRYTVGPSVIPSTKNDHATASATAVIEFRCTLKSAPQLPDNPGQGEDGERDHDKGEDESKDTPGLFEFRCDGGQDVTIDLTDKNPLPELGKLIFSVHLIDS